MHHLSCPKEYLSTTCDTLPIFWEIPDLPKITELVNDKARIQTTICHSLSFHCAMWAPHSVSELFSEAAVFFFSWQCFILVHP